MDHTDARRRNHWVSHIARHAHAKPGAVYLRFEGASVTWAQIHERVGVDGLPRNASGKVMKTALRRRFGTSPRQAHDSSDV
jgi:acyl-CoA synthetase (AMP-forming)/AMP-acid ligase II